MQGIADIATTGDKDSTRLAAYIALGKVAGVDLFREIVIKETRTRTAADVEQELRDKLNELAGTMRDVTPGATAQPLPAPGKSDRRRKPASDK